MQHFNGMCFDEILTCSVLWVPDWKFCTSSFFSSEQSSNECARMASSVRGFIHQQLKLEKSTELWIKNLIKNITFPVDSVEQSDLVANLNVQPDQVLFSIA